MYYDQPLEAAFRGVRLYTIGRVRCHQICDIEPHGNDIIHCCDIQFVAKLTNDGVFVIPNAGFRSYKKLVRSWIFERLYSKSKLKG